MKKGAAKQHSDLLVNEPKKTLRSANELTGQNPLVKKE